MAAGGVFRSRAARLRLFGCALLLTATCAVLGARRADARTAPARSTMLVAMPPQGTPSTVSGAIVPESAVGVVLKPLVVGMPLVHMRGRVLRERDGRVAVRLRCTGWQCRGTVKIERRELVIVRHGHRRLRRHRLVAIGSAHYRLAAGRSGSFRVRLAAKERRALLSAKHRRLGVTLVASVTGGSRATRHMTVVAGSAKHHRQSTRR